MDSIASFSAYKVGTSHFLYVDGIMDGLMLQFLFDTGAVCSLIGLDSLFAANEVEKKTLFENILQEEIAAQQISARPISLKTANNQPVSTYPCVSHGVSVEGSQETDFFFDFTFGDISLPLLGTSFSDDCSYRHEIGGALHILGMAKNPGASRYKDEKVLDFDTAVLRYEKTLLNDSL